MPWIPDRISLLFRVYETFLKYMAAGLWSVMSLVVSSSESSSWMALYLNWRRERLARLIRCSGLIDLVCGGVEVTQGKSRTRIVWGNCRGLAIGRLNVLGFTLRGVQAGKLHVQRQVLWLARQGTLDEWDGPFRLAACRIHRADLRQDIEALRR